MQKLKRYIPFVAGVLIALGISLEQYGIDLNSLTGGNASGTASSHPATDNEKDGTSASLSHDSANATSADVTSADAAIADMPHWSDTDPNINLWHVFHGEINRSGKPVGFHSRPGGQDPENARLVSIQDPPNRHGVYTATVEVRDGNQWKRKFSSFFPDSMSSDEVIAAILNAYHNSSNPNAQPFEGPSGHGFRIQAYTSSRGGINTAFPIHVRD
ncbi:MAG: hypothetical protein CSB44_10590 [Gammaproteobacteria bacterium]|nr:MAG: hypothetical protein CSB44_10590 [Gammaproteobacteria bacterium]PIE36118.1 MAG: hypothetical protein CSA54_04940 [Gammaproteobacteria bacterium]